MKKFLPKISQPVWILILIILLGIFLRAYHFHDWLTFNPDQARDAMLVGNVLKGKSSWIMLGPEAGNTHFDLGPWFYHLEILSAKIFGNAPDKLAYPDFIFSILTILLFYILIKRYFSQKLSLLLTFFLSISYFMIRYSRFAFNPNSIPFFLLLFFLGNLYLLENKKAKWWGAILTGIGVGVGIQLHAILIFTLPTVAGLVFFYLFFKKESLKTIFKEIGLVVLLILITNTGQIIYSFNHGNSNLHRFRKSFIQSAGDGGENIGEEIKMVVVCQSTSNLHILTSLGSGEKCSSYNTIKKIRRRSLPLNLKNSLTLGWIFGSIIFTLGGYILLFYFWKKEKDKQRKNFLLLISAYAGITFITMVPIISQASIRYYIVLFFLPFVFLGLWIKYFWEKGKGKYVFKSIVIIIIFIIGLQFKKINQVYNQYKTLSFSNTRVVALDEAEIIMRYIADSAYPQKTVYIAGKTKYFSRYYKPFLYLSKKFYPQLKIKRGDKTKKIKPGATIFYLSKPLSVAEIKKKTFLGRKVKSYKIFAHLVIIKY